MSEREDILRSDGERFLPWMEDPIISYEHLHRYAFAKEFVKGKKVLDLACGEGYGSAMLAEDAEEVIGVDINECAVKHANTKYVKKNLRFIKSSITEVAISGHKLFDIIVCFEALEHVCEHDKVIAEVKRLLKHHGIFILSTPNKYLYTDQRPLSCNSFHVKELYLDEFKKLLDNNFGNALIYGQKVYPVTNIFPLFEGTAAAKEYVIEKGAEAFSFTKSEKKQAMYFIATASDGSLEDPAGNSYMVDISETVFRQYGKIIKELEMAGSIPGVPSMAPGRAVDRLFPAGTLRRKFANAVYLLFFDRKVFLAKLRISFNRIRKADIRSIFFNHRESQPKIAFPFPESALARKYCIGRGLEIGGSAHNPFGLNALNVDFTDSMDTEFKKEEIRRCGRALKVDIVANGDNIPLPDESQDFIVSSHVIEHFPNPIKALMEWDRLVKSGGIIFMIVPHKERTFDKGKECTPLEHLTEDFRNNSTLPHGDIDGHDHCWITETFVELIKYMIEKLNMEWEIVQVQDVDDKVGNGFTIVIRKLAAASSTGHVH